MPIGSYRDDPSDHGDIERAVAAAQYPEGGLVIGLGTGIAVGAMTTSVVLVVGPFVGGLTGYKVGNWFRLRRLQQRRRDRSVEN